MNIAPGEPVPPGFENEVKSITDIQSVIDNFQDNQLTKPEFDRNKGESDSDRHFLGTTVELSDGTKGFVFSRGPKNEAGHVLYNCHICAVPNLPGERCLRTHITGRKHRTKLSQPFIDAATFRAPFVPKGKNFQMNIAPGEPVPPGFENEVKPLAEIQTVIDSFKDGALIGIEYAVELKDDDKEPAYICLLCDKRGDPRTIFSHWTSYNHRLKYLEKHFPTVIKELVPYRYNPDAKNAMPRIIQMICEAIEDHHGRLTPSVCDATEFKKSRNALLQDIIYDKHLDEKNGPNFVNVVDTKVVNDIIRASKGTIAISIESNKKRSPSPPIVRAPKRSKSDNNSTLRKSRDSLDSISSDSDSSLTHSGYRDHQKKRTKAQSPAYRIMPRVRRSPPFEEDRDVPKKTTLPTPRELSKQASEIAQERYKWEKYRCMVDIAVKELEKTLKDHEKNPEKHPLYPDEWKKFWNRRYKELQAEKKDPNKHDFKPEWIIFWTKRMKELHEEEIDKKRIEIKKKIGLPENAEEKTDQLKQLYKVKAPPRVEKPSMVIDISDDDTSLSSPPRSKKTRKSKTRSLSPFSDDYELRRKDRYHSRDRERHFPSSGSRDARDRDARDRDARDRETRDRDYYRHAGPNQWGPYYGGPPPPPGPHYGYRTMDSYSYPKYEPVKNDSIEEDDGPLTVVSVLRLLTALEDHLGSLGPKVVDMLAKALALEKVKANSSDEMLLNDDTSVFFETVKEKLKGQLIADVLDSNKVKAVKKAIKNIAGIIHQVTEKATKKDETEDKKEEDPKCTDKKTEFKKDQPFDRQLVATKLAAALVMEEKTDISTDDMNKLIHAFVLMVKLSKDRGGKVLVKDVLLELGIVLPDTTALIMEEQSKEDEIDDADAIMEEMFGNEEDQDDSSPVGPAGALDSLTDSDLQTLLQNFKHLSTEEQHHLIAHLKKLEASDPIRVEKLRKFVNVKDINEEKVVSPAKSNQTDKSIERQAPVLKYQNAEKDKIPKMIDTDDDDDDDDYNFEDIVRIASNNAKDRKNTIEVRTIEAINRDREDDISNMSRASSTSTANLNMSLADTQNLIANLMGSLQKNSATLSQQITPVNSNIPTLVSRGNNSSNNTNLAFYQQQQQQQQHQMPQKIQLHQHQQQQQQQQQMNQQQIPPLQMRSQNLNQNNLFFQENYNNPDPPSGGTIYRAQHTGNYNFNFPSFQQSNQSNSSNPPPQILQDFISQQNNFRTQRNNMDGNY